MRYHSNTKTVLIVLLITIVFALSSVFLLFRLNLTSPTLIVTDALMNEISNADSSLSFSFEGMERNFRDRVMIRSFSLFWEEEEIAFFDTVEIKLGLFDMISYFLNLEGSMEINFRNGEVRLGSLFEGKEASSSRSEALTGGKAENGLEKTGEDNILSSFLSSHSMTLSFNNISLFSPLGDGVIDEMSLTSLGKDGKIVGEIHVPSLSIRNDAFSCDISDTSLSLTLGSTIFAEGKTEKVNADNISAGGTLRGIEFSIRAESISSLAEGLFNGLVRVESVDGKYESSSFLLSSSEIIYKDRDISLSSSSLSLLFSSFEAELSSLNMSLSDFNRYEAEVDTIKTVYSDTEFIGSDFKLNGSLEDKKLDYLLGEIKTDIGGKSSNHIGKVKISGAEGSVDYNDGLSLTLNLSSLIRTQNEKVDDITFDLSASILLRNGFLEESSVSVNNLYLGYGEKYDSSLSLSGDMEKAEIRFDYGSFDVDLTASVKNKRLSGKVLVSDLKAKRIFSLFLNDKSSFIDDEASYSLSAFLDLGFDKTLSGYVSYEMNLDSIKLAFLETQIGSKGRFEFQKDKILFDSVTLDTSYFSLSSSGYWDLIEKLPTLDFKSMNSKGDETARGYIHLSESGRTYSYYCLFPTLNETYISGDVDFERKEEVVSSSTLVTNSSSRPFFLAVNLDSRKISVVSDYLSLFFDYSDGIKGSLSASKLETLHSLSSLAMTLDGSLDFEFSFEEGLVLSSSIITISDIFFLPSTPSISFSLGGRGTVYSLENLSISSLSGPTYTGKASMDLEKNILAFSIHEKDGEGSIVFSLYKDKEFVAALKAGNINLSFLALEDAFLSFSLFGRAKRIEDFSFDGSVTVLSPQSSGEKMNADITINGTSLSIGNVVYSAEDILGEVERVSFDSKSGILLVDGGKLHFVNDKAAGAMPVDAQFSLSGETVKTDSLFSTVLELISNKGSGSSLRIDVESLDLASIFSVKERFLTLDIKDDEINLGGNFINGRYSLDDRNAEIDVDIDNIVKCTLSGVLSDVIRANVRVDLFNMALVNLFMVYPTVVFRDDLVKGEASFILENGNASLNGYISSEELAVEVFWLEDQTLILHNPRFVIWDNDLRCSLTYTTVFDKLTSERKMVKMNVGLTLSESLSLESWDVDVYIDDNNSVRVRIPLFPVGVDILGYVSGHYYAFSDENGMRNEGVLNLSNTDVTIGMNPFPDWYRNITGAVLMDLRFNIGKNNRVLYPAGQDPIVSITLQEDSSVYAFSDLSTFSCSGNVAIRGGELYYFQKYFYITSGSLSFDDASSFNPKINLRATLREYDSSSEKVEIYLVMKDNTFDNLSPTLESSPSKDLNEIMEILGQSILSSETYASVSVSSVASLVTEGFDILSRLGIVTTGSNPLSSLSSSLKSVFGVDTFSLHSNILNNIVTDTISQATQSGVGNYSPMARFLSGTTLNIGKYLSQNLYLQIMVHLEAKRSNESYTIISDDLALDTEISLEWANSAFSVTFFTRPSYFSFYSILSTFGFSISKTINF